MTGTLMSAGGVLGLAGTIGTVFPFSVLGVISFGLVLSFGAFVYRKRPEARLLAAATLWFAPLGGVAAVIIILFARGLASDVLLFQGSLGLVGMGCALTGAIVKHHGLSV
jgi:hypothetical protein